MSDEKIRRIIDNAAPETTRGGSTAWPAPLGEAAYHGLAGEYLRLVAPETEADPAGLLAGFLVLVGHAVGRTAYVQVGAARHYANLFAVVVGGSGSAGRKGTAWGEARRVMKAADSAAAARIRSGAVSGEGMVWEIRDPIVGLNRKTGESEITDPGVADKRLLLREGEFASVLKVTARESNTLSALLRDAWDSPEELATMAKNSPARATEPHISMHGDITPEELRRLLTETEMANGFGNRICWFAVKRSQLLPEGGNVDPGALDRLALRLGDTLNRVRGFGEIRRDQEATALWHDRYANLTRDRFGLIGALNGRAETQVQRLSLAYALLDRSPVITVRHLEAALEVWRYCEESTAYIFGGRTGDQLADRLLRLLRGQPVGLTRQQIRDALGRNYASDRITAALDELQRHGLARCESVPTGGRTATRWHATDGGGQ